MTASHNEFWLSCGAYPGGIGVCILGRESYVFQRFVLRTRGVKSTNVRIIINSARLSSHPMRATHSLYITMRAYPIRVGGIGVWQNYAGVF